MTNEQIVIELKAVCALITHGKATGQDKGRWMENLVKERLALLDAYNLEDTAAVDAWCAELLK